MPAGLDNVRATSPNSASGIKNMTPPSQNHHMRNQSADQEMLRSASPLETFTDDIILRVNSQVTNLTTNSSDDLILDKSKMAPTK